MSSPNQSKDLLRPSLGDRQRSGSSNVQRAPVAGIYGSPPVPNIPLRGAGGSNSATNGNDEDSYGLSRSPAAAATRRVSPRPSSPNLQVPGSGSGAVSHETSPGPSISAADELTEEQKAEIVARHLVDKKGQRRASKSASNVARPSPMSRGQSSQSNNDNDNDDIDDARGTATDEDEEDVERIRNMQMSTDEFPVSFGKYYVL